MTKYHVTGSFSFEVVIENIDSHVEAESYDAACKMVKDRIYADFAAKFEGAHEVIVHHANSVHWS